MHIYIHTYIHTYICVYRQRDRSIKRERERERERKEPKHGALESWFMPVGIMAGFLLRAFFLFATGVADV